MLNNVYLAEKQVEWARRGRSGPMPHVERKRSRVLAKMGRTLTALGAQLERWGGPGLSARRTAGA